MTKFKIGDVITYKPVFLYNITLIIKKISGDSYILINEFNTLNYYYSLNYDYSFIDNNYLLHSNIFRIDDEQI